MYYLPILIDSCMHILLLRLDSHIYSQLWVCLLRLSLGHTFHVCHVCLQLHTLRGNIPTCYQAINCCREPLKSPLSQWHHAAKGDNPPLMQINSQTMPSVCASRLLHSCLIGWVTKSLVKSFLCQWFAKPSEYREGSQFCLEIIHQGANDNSRHSSKSPAVTRKHQALFFFFFFSGRLGHKPRRESSFSKAVTPSQPTFTRCQWESTGLD